MTTDTTTRPDQPSVLLVPGHWLGAWAWEEVRDALQVRGVAASSVTLPGLDPDDPERATVSLTDQVSWLLKRVTADAAPPVVVAHSGAGQVISGVLDQAPSAVSRVIYVDSGPFGGGPFVPDLPEQVEEVPLPPFDELGEQASLEGLDEPELERFRTSAVPMPRGVMAEPLALRNDDPRRSVPTTLVCCSIPSAQMLALAERGHPMFAEVAQLTDREVVDLPTGHWPMWSRPADLAAVIAERVS